MIFNIKRKLFANLAEIISNSSLGKGENGESTELGNSMKKLLKRYPTNSENADLSNVESNDHARNIIRRKIKKGDITKEDYAKARREGFSYSLKREHKKKDQEWLSAAEDALGSADEGVHPVTTLNRKTDARHGGKKHTRRFIVSRIPVQGADDGNDGRLIDPYELNSYKKSNPKTTTLITPAPSRQTGTERAIAEERIPISKDSRVIGPGEMKDKLELKENLDKDKNVTPKPSATTEKQPADTNVTSKSSSPKDTKPDSTKTKGNNKVKDNKNKKAAGFWKNLDPKYKKAIKIGSWTTLGVGSVAAGTYGLNKYLKNKKSKEKEVENNRNLFLNK